MNTNKSENPWHVLLLRLTAFPRALEDVGKELDWEALVGEAPETVEQQPRAKATISKGHFINGELIHSRHADRVELIYSANYDAGFIAGAALPSLGDLETALKDYKPTLMKWLDGLPPVKRIAFGSVLRLPVADHKEAYERLNHFLQYVEVLPNSSDFLYQINRPRLSGVKGELLINRITKWNAIKATGLQVGGGKEVVTQEKFACQLEMDVNTHQSFEGAFTNEEIHSLFDELQILSLEITEKGEIE